MLCDILLMVCCEKFHDDDEVCDEVDEVCDDDE
jgi:hypothetical protein